MPPVLTRLQPPSPLVRRLSAQSALFAVGEGAFLTSNAVFFTRVVGLTAAQVGLGLTIAGVAAFLAAVPSGKLSDRFGAQRMWTVSAVLSGLLYLAYPLVSGFVGYLILVVVLEVVAGVGHAGRGAYTLDLFRREQRVRAQAYMRAALNLGFTVGAGLGGVALAFDSDAVVRAVPVLAGAVLLTNSVLVSRLPAARAGGDHAVDAADQGLSRSALRNRGFLAMNVCDGVLSTNGVLLTVVIPLWLVQQTDAPHVLLAWLFGTNTVLAVALQVSASRGAETVTGALRASRISAGFMVVSCILVLFTDSTIGWATIALVWIGHVTVTGAELFQSAGSWGLLAELSDPRRRGEYQGAATLGHTLGFVWAPAAYTALAIDGGAVGWLTIGGIVVLAAVGIGPSARAAERHLAAETVGVRL